MIAAAWGSDNRGRTADPPARRGRRPGSGRPGAGERPGPLLRPAPAPARRAGRRRAPRPPPVEAGVGQGQHAVGVEGERHGAGPDEDVLGVAGQEARGPGRRPGRPSRPRRPPMATTARISRLSNISKLVPPATDSAAPKRAPATPGHGGREGEDDQLGRGQRRARGWRRPPRSPWWPPGPGRRGPGAGPGWPMEKRAKTTARKMVKRLVRAHVAGRRGRAGGWGPSRRSRRRPTRGRTRCP